MASRSALYVMPSFAVVAVAVIVLGPGRERPALGVRVWGHPVTDASHVALRLETLERQLGADELVPVSDLTVLVTQPGRQPGSWTGASGADGIAEVVVPLNEVFRGPFEVKVTRGGRVLAEGRVPTASPESIQPSRDPIRGAAKGPIELRVILETGVLAAPFTGSVRVRALARGSGLAGASLRVTAEGAQILGAGGPLVTDRNGEATFELQPTWHSVDLKIEASSLRDRAPPDGAKADGAPPDGAPAEAAPPLTGTWEGPLPVKPGALWLSADGRAVISPVPRERVYLSGYGQGRIHGAVVPLKKTEAGLFEGSIDVAELSKKGILALTISGDFQERGAGTVTWHLAEHAVVETAPRVGPLVDGLPAAELREKTRASNARLAAVAVLAMAAILEAVLMILHGRASQAKLAAHLAEASETDEERAAAAKMIASKASRAFTLVVAVGLVVLAFGAVAAFTIVR